jgi:hypothetical protein
MKLKSFPLKNYWQKHSLEAVWLMCISNENEVCFHFLLFPHKQEELVGLPSIGSAIAASP